ncbi:MAG: pilus assembly protein PilP [Nitrospirota bacterium]
MKKWLIILVSLLGIIIGAAAAVYFTGKGGSAQKPAAPAKAAPAPAKTPSPAQANLPVKSPAPAEANAQDAEKKTVPVYEYTSQGRRDPFMPLVVKADIDKKGLTPIESYEVVEFKLIAVLWNRSGYYAVITLPDGKSYTIREGMKLGLHRGKVQRITRDAVIIREHVRDYSGVVNPRDTILKLRREEEG